MADERATKHDAGKPRMDLLDPYAIRELAKVLEFGARKYAPWNWTKGMEYSRLMGAALRHMMAFQEGEDLDPESGLPHVAHAMCCLMFLLGMTVRKPEMDDRCPLPAEKTKLNPCGFRDGDRRFAVGEQAALDVASTTRELELEQVLRWAMGYDVQLSGLPDFHVACEATTGRYAWRTALRAKLESMGVKL